MHAIISCIKKTVFPGVVAFMLLAVAMSVMADEARLVKQDNGIVRDTRTGLMWQFEKSPHKFSDAAKAAAYAAQLELGGYDDWRLPTLAERWDLLQVFVFKNDGGLEFPKFKSKYWTRETEKGTQPIKLDITCTCRGDQEVEFKNDGYVRTVRMGNMQRP